MQPPGDRKNQRKNTRDGFQKNESSLPLAGLSHMPLINFLAAGINRLIAKIASARTVTANCQ